MLEKTLLEILCGAGGRIAERDPGGILGLLFNDIVGLVPARSQPWSPDPRQPVNAALEQVASQARALEDELAALSGQLGRSRVAVARQTARLGCCLDSITRWFDIDYRQLGRLAVTGQADPRAIDELLDPLLDNDVGVAATLFDLHAFIAEDQVQGALSAVVDALITDQGLTDPRTAHRFIQSWFLRLVWAQLQGLTLLVDALNYVGAHPERQSERTKQAIRLTWPGSPLEYCLEVFIPKLRRQVMVYLSCVEKLAAVAARPSLALHRPPPGSIAEILGQADLLAQEAGGFTVQEPGSPLDALVVRLVGSPGWVRRFGPSWTASLVLPDGRRQALPLEAVRGYSPSGVLSALRRFEIRGRQARPTAAPGLDLAGSAPSPGAVAFAKYQPPPGETLALPHGQDLVLRLSPGDGAGHRLRHRRWEGAPRQTGHPPPASCYHVVVYETGLDAASAARSTGLRSNHRRSPRDRWPKDPTLGPAV